MKKRRQLRVISRLMVVLVNFVIFAFFVMPVAACPMCKRGLDANANSTQAAIGEAMSWTIYGMLILPTMLVIGIGVMIWRRTRRQQSVQNR